MGYNTIAHKVFPTEKRIKTIQDVGAQFSDPNSAQQSASLLGLLSMDQDLTELVQLTPSVVNSLRWWMESQNLRVGSPTHCPKSNVQVFTDLSTQGWGAHLGMNLVSGKWNKSQAKYHINLLEQMAVRLALQHWEYVFLNKMGLVATDNSTVVAFVNKQGGGGGDIKIPVLGSQESVAVGTQAKHSHNCKTHTVQITFIFIDFRVCDFAFAFKTQNAPCVSRFKCVLFSDRFQFAF